MFVCVYMYRYRNRYVHCSCFINTISIYDQSGTCDISFSFRSPQKILVNRWLKHIIKTKQANKIILSTKQSTSVSFDPTHY